ncbi:MAG: acetyl-mannosamine transferase [Patescibacteria group bacterium]|nr:MAG: acetyl-mannosamine transferase [Patescibacteria group bacterium]
MIEKDQKQAKILDIALDSISRNRVLREVRVKLALFEAKSPIFKPFYIVTPNPEIVLEAQKDRELALILNSADFAIPDGIGLAQSNLFLSLPNYSFLPLRFLALIFGWLKVFFLTLFSKDKLFSGLNVIKGRRLFEDLIFLANKKKFRVVLIGDDKQSAQKAAGALKGNYKKVNIFAFSGPRLDREGKPFDDKERLKEKEIINSINKIRPHLVFVGFGAPKQEKWIWRNKDKLDVGGMMVVGGTFDYVSGRLKYPPRFLEKAGLEWLWRLLVQPKRLGRIFRAVFVFPVKVSIYKFKKGS